jgi:hypothetical protein
MSADVTRRPEMFRDFQRFTMTYRGVEGCILGAGVGFGSHFCWCLLSCPKVEKGPGRRCSCLMVVRIEVVDEKKKKKKSLVF